MSKLCPIFLISLPRSGSTLLQKILTTSPDIHSVSETWLMLPFAFMSRKEGVLTTYSHNTAFYALEDFVRNLPNGQKDFYTAIEKFSISLYSKTLPDANIKYFLDKTPRYYLIVSFLAEVFPAAKFIFLFRNPLEVLSSILSTWMNDRFFIYKHYIDLFHGPHGLSNGHNMLRDRSIAINYKDLVESPEVELQRICSYLQISFDPSMLVDFNNVKFEGRMGDQKGSNSFRSISSSPLANWESILNTHYRKWFAKKYVKSMGDKTLRSFGTSLKELTQEIDSISNLRRGSIEDAFCHSISTIMRWIYVDYYKKKLVSFKAGERCYPYM